MGINKNFIVNAGLNVGTTANVATSIGVGGSLVVNTTTISINGATVNSTYYSGTANNSVYFDGNGSEYYTNATNLDSGTIPYARIPVNVINTTSNFTITGNYTFNANVSIETGKELILSSTSGISANGTLGTSGYALKTNGNGVYWAVDEQGVTSVASGNGISGGIITTTGTLYAVAANGIQVDATGIGVKAGNNQLIANTTGLFVDQTKINHDSLSGFVGNEHIDHSAVSISPGSGLTGGGNIAASRTLAVQPGTGIIANTTGVHVDPSYIGTLSVTNSTNLNGQAASYYTNITARLGYTPMNSAGGTFSGPITVPSSLTVNAEGAEGGQIVLKKGSGMSTGGDIYMDGIGAGLRIYDNNGSTYPQFNFNLASGSITGQGGTFWHSGNDGAGSGLDADLLDGWNLADIINIPARLGYTPVQQGTGIGQSTNTVKIGWSGSRVKVTIDGSDQGNMVFDGHIGDVWRASNDGSGSGLDADLVDGWHRDSIRDWNNILNKPWNWSGQGGQPTWLWGGNNNNEYYVYNPANFSVNYANSSGNADTVDGYHATQLMASGDLSAKGYLDIRMNDGRIFRRCWGTKTVGADTMSTDTFAAGISTVLNVYLGGGRLSTSDDGNMYVLPRDSSSVHLINGLGAVATFYWTAEGIA